jgi:class 3 adenylate cyclase
VDSIAEWLQEIGLEKYTGLFAEKEITLDVLPHLTEADIGELGLPIGARRRLMVAIQMLATSARAQLPTRPRETALEQLSIRTRDAERRQLTVMFCDLVSSTELATRLDPEQYRELVRAYQSVCEEIINNYAGYIAQYLGDGLLVYFGYPAAHEDDAQRAVRAGLAMLHAIAHLQLASGPLAARIGIHTGIVVVGDIGSGTSREQLAVGGTPNVAARLQGIAPVNALILSDNTRHLTGGSFEYRDLGAHLLKGITEPIRAWEALRESGAESRFEAASGGKLAPMVGRDLEFAVLMHAWQRARSGKGQLVLLAGEPGVGKSRVLRALREKLAEDVAILWQYQCSPYFSNSALYPVLDSLERALHYHRDEAPASKLDKLERLLEQYGRPPLDANLIGHLLSLPVESRYSRLSMTAQKQKEETLRALSDMVRAAANARPLLILLEDLHWADTTTVEWIDNLVAGLNGIAVLLVATYRPEFKPQWIGQPSVTALTLGRLDPAQTRAIIDRVAAGNPLPEEILAQIVAKTDGIPLFAEELTKAIVESSMLTLSSVGYRLSGPLPALAIPSTLRDSLVARLDRLAPIKEVAQIGACIGREFSEELLAQVCSMPGAELQRALQQLTESELVFRRGQPPHQTYVFKHVLIQEAAADSLLRAKRIQIHARIGKVLEEQFPEIVASQPERIAYHYTEAGLAQNAIPYWQKAGELALQRMAAADAVAHFDQGIALVQQMAASEIRDTHELELRTALGMTWIALQGWGHPSVVSNWARGWELAQQLDRSDHSLRLLWGQWMIRLAGGRNRESLSWTELMLSEGERSNREDLRLGGHCAALNAYFFLGEFTRVIDHAQAVLSLFDQQRHRHIADVLTLDPKTYALAYEGLAQWMLGYPDRAVKSAQAAIEHGRGRGHPFNLGWALQFIAKHLDVYRRDSVACATKLDEFDRLAHEQRIGFFERVAGPICRAAWLLISDRPEEAAARFLDSIPRWVEAGLATDVPYFKTLHAHSAAMSGQLDVALNLADEALEQIGRPGWEECGFLAEALRVRGWIHQLRGNLNRADSDLQDCLEVSRQQAARSWELRGATTYAKLLMDQGRCEEGRELLEPIYNWFTEGFATRDLIDARTLLHELRR